MSGKRERAVWGLAEEQALLELFRQARNNAQVRSERGVKARGWLSIVVEINRRCGRSFDKDQLKSKYARIMQEYELYKAIGADKNGLEQVDWEREIEQRPKHASLLKQFREHGFAHADICSRIAGDKEDTADASPLPLVSEDVVGVKRSPTPEETDPELKKIKLDGKKERASWKLKDESLMLFLYLRARNDLDVRSEKGISIRGRGWMEVVTEFNRQCGTNLDKDQVKSKFTRIMAEYEQFKTATGFSGELGTEPRTTSDWDTLLSERPDYNLQLKQFKEKGELPHLELCSLIAGDAPTKGLKQASLSEFMATGVVLVPDTPAPSESLAQAQSPLETELRTSNEPLQQTMPSIANITANQPAASAAASALPFLLPANLAAQLQPSAARSSQPGTDPAAAMDPAFFTTELRDNLNTFLKTATAYLEMLIEDHNQN